MTENTDTTQQGTPQSLLPIMIPAVLFIAIIILFFMWQDADSGRSDAQESGTEIAALQQENAEEASTAIAERDQALIERDSALAEATEALELSIQNDTLASTADASRIIAETAQAEAEQAQEDAENALTIAESDSESAVATAEFAVIVQETAQSVAGTQAVEAEIAQGTAVAALAYQETAIAIAATAILEREDALASQEDALSALDAVESDASEAQARLEAIERLLTLNAARLGVVLNQLATAEAQTDMMEATNQAIVDNGGVIPSPPPPTLVPAATVTPGGPTPAPSNGLMTFVSNDASYSFEHPESWFLVADIGEDTVIANTESASVEITESTEPVPSSGDFWMYVAVFDLGSVGDLGNFLTAAVGDLRPDATLSEATTFSVADYGDPATVSYLDLVGENNRLLIVDLGGGYYGFFDITANADEIDGFMSEILIVADTLSYTPSGS